MALLGNSTASAPPPPPASGQWPALTDGTYPQPPVGNGASVTISTLAQDTIVAPASIWFEVTGWTGFDPSGPASGKIYDPRLHEITYIWTVRGRAISGFSAVSNMVDEWNNERIAYGPRVVLTFQEPDTYTIDLWATDGTNTARASTTVVVQNPDDVYSGTRTICVSTAVGETWAGEVPGCQRATSLSEAQTIIDAASVPHRLLLKRGQTYTSAPNGEIRMNGNGLGYVGAWGSGAKPVLDDIVIATRSGTLVTQFTADNIKFQGGWDSVNPPPATGNRNYIPLTLNSSNTECNYHVANCAFDGCARVDMRTKTTTSGLVENVVIALTNNDITNWRDYGIFWGANNPVPGSRVSLVGNRVHQSLQANNNWQGAQTKSGTLENIHAPCRIATADVIYVGVEEHFIRHGWAGNDQPSYRFMTDANRGDQLYCDRIVGEGGSSLMTLTAADSANNPSPMNIIVDKALLICTTATNQQMIAVGMGGTRLRNVLGIRFNAPIYSSASWDGCVDVITRGGNPTAENLTEPMIIHNCTFYSAMSQANDNGGGWQLYSETDYSFQDVRLANNITHAPSIGSPVTSSSPLDISSVLSEITTLYVGVKIDGQNGGAMQTQFGTDGLNPPLVVPQSGSPAYQTATGSGLVAYDDFFGRVRGANPSRGAIEP